MSSYESLAASYDALTQDVLYQARADYLQKLLRRCALPVHTVLDLACGTGTMTCLLANRGYEMIGVDASADMLAEAAAKVGSVTGEKPIFLQQSMPRLDLYGTVDAAICCLDSLNYLTRPEDVRRTFDRLRLFVAPGGMLVFDVVTQEKLSALDGQIFLDETEDTYCVWRAEYRKRSRTIIYGMELFQRTLTGQWKRSTEEHQERAYSVEELTAWLRSAGFTHIKTYGDRRLRPPAPGEERIYFSCIRGK